MAFKDQARRIRDLENAGCLQADVGENSWSKVLMKRPAADPAPDYRPPAGFTVRPLAGDEEAAGYVALHQAIFESKNMTLPWKLRILCHPAHRADLDLVAVAPDGRLGAFCVCWMSTDGREAQRGTAGLPQGFPALRPGASNPIAGADPLAGSRG